MHKRPLTRERIISTAIELADREGLPEVSLRRIASRLGVHVTSLYNHVATKEAVLDGIVERLMTEAKLPRKVSGWEDWVRKFAGGLRRIAHKHPGAMTAFHHRPVQGPHAVEFPEAGLEAFCSAGFDISEAYCAVNATALTVLGLLLEEVGQHGDQAPSTNISELAPLQFPRTHELRKLKKEPDVWSYAIDCLVRGLAVDLEGRGGRRRKNGLARARRSKSAAKAP